jgi:hypothetical protein
MLKKEHKEERYGRSLVHKIELFGMRIILLLSRSYTV